MTVHRMIAGGIALLVAGCGPAGSGGTREASPSSRMLLADEIRTVGATNAYQAVTRLRPTWLRSRGVVSLRNPSAGEVVVYLDGVRFGGPRSLESIQAESIFQIEYLDPSDAHARFGIGHLGGAIVVRTR